MVLCADDKQHKTKRLKGESYLGYTRTKFGEVQQNREVPARTLGERCNHNLLQPKSERSLMCGQITEKARQNQLEYLWKLETWGAKEAYIRGIVHHNISYDNLISSE